MTWEPERKQESKSQSAPKPIRSTTFLWLPGELIGRIRCVSISILLLRTKGGSGGAGSAAVVTNSSGHKGSLRGTKIARRARSFKDDFLEKISQMRTPSSTLNRWVRKSGETKRKGQSTETGETGCWWSWMWSVESVISRNCAWYFRTPETVDWWLVVGG